MYRRMSDANPAQRGTRLLTIALELKKVIRLAGRDPDALEAELPALCAFHRVASAGELDEATRVHLVLHHLIPGYLDRLPGGRDCRAIRELLTWEDADGELLSLTTRYHKAAAHLIGAASDFGRRQEPRLLRECARRFIALDNEDRLGAPAAPVDATAAQRAVESPDDEAPVIAMPVIDALGGIARVQRHLDYHLIADLIADAQQITILNTWIPGIDILADALLDALARGATVSILLVDPDSDVANLRSRALQGSTPCRFRDGPVGPGVRHCLDVLATISHVLDLERQPNLRVRLYDSIPSMSVYSVDERAFVSFFLHGELAVRSAQIEVLGLDSIMGKLVAREIQTLWSTGQELDPPEEPVALAV